ncbi:MAG: homoaconitase [Phycisphaerae bacterium]|jgi:homoaconitate hydratase
MAQTLIEKIAQAHAVGLQAGHEVHAGDFLSIRPAHCMTHDNTAAVIPKFKSIGATRVFDPRQPVFALDHDIQNHGADNLAAYAKIEAFALEQHIDFYPAGRGIGHQVMMEEGYVLPGSLVVASDSHANIYGALAALGTPVVRTDAAAIWATGRTWWQVPEIVRVTLRGALPTGVCGKDVVLSLIATFCHDEVLNCCVEFTGPGVATLSIEDRMAIANMTTEWGALAGAFPYDAVTEAYLESRAEAFHARGDMNRRITRERVAAIDRDPPRADVGAYYAKEIDFDLAAVQPFVAGPNDVRAATPAAELEALGIRIDKAFLMSCVNGRIEDFQAAADVLCGKRIAPSVKFYIGAASSEIESQARHRGYWHTLLEAGATPLPPGCGACIGLGEGVLADGEVGISATNRNFDGRMGSRNSLVYLAGPAVVAASALAGKIAAPPVERLRHESGVEADVAGAEEPALRVAVAAETAASPRASTATATAASARWLGSARAGAPERAAQSPSLRQRSAAPTCRAVPRAGRAQRAAVSILPGFPPRIEGELLLLPKDNLNTDGIYGKDYTYKQLPPQEMAKVAMLNYDPKFQELARDGDILVGGFNFGCGSSREQAATALKHRGIRLLIAGSFSQTFSRNAFNNGYICVECPALVESLKHAFQGAAERTIRTGWRAVVDFERSRVICQPCEGGRQPSAASREAETGEYAFSPLGPVAQELIVAGGFEAVIRRQLAH